MTLRKSLLRSFYVAGIKVAINIIKKVKYLSFSKRKTKQNCKYSSHDQLQKVENKNNDYLEVVNL